MGRIAIIDGNVPGVYFVHKILQRIVWELVTAPPESLPTRQMVLKTVIRPITFEVLSQILGPLLISAHHLHLFSQGWQILFSLNNPIQ